MTRSYREGLATGFFGGGAWYVFCTIDHPGFAAILLVLFLVSLYFDRRHGYWAD